MSQHLLIWVIIILSGIYNPYEFEPPHSGGSEITHKDAPQSVELLWTSDQPVAETSTWQHKQQSQRTTNHAPPAGFFFVCIVSVLLCPDCPGFAFCP